MIRQKILFLPHTDCRHPRLRPFAQQLGMSVNWDPEIRVGKPLEKVFEQVLRYDVGNEYAAHGVSATNARLVELVRRNRPKYVFWPTMSYEILEETFWEIRRLGAYVVGWFFDDECRFDEYSRWWIPHMDYIFTGDKASIPRYQQLGAKALHLLVTSDPDCFKPTPSNRRFEVSFVGSKSVADRDHLVERLKRDGVAVTTFGKGWDGGFISNDGMLQVYSNSKINLCFTKSYGSGTRNQLKSKIFDITMCGGFLLCEHAEGLEDYFAIGREIECFRDDSEAVEKIRVYLNNDALRGNVARAGRERSVKDYAQHRLLEQAFEILERHSQDGGARVLPRTACDRLSSTDRSMKARYHANWAQVLAGAHFERTRWEDELALARKYDPKVEVRLEAPEKGRPMLRPDPYETLFLGLKETTLRFLERMKLGETVGSYRYAQSCSKPTIYSSAYAVMTFSLYGMAEHIRTEERKAWVGYFDAFQSPHDGLFYDPQIHNALYAEGDWWGARHFALHAIPAYTALGSRPRTPFRFLDPYLDVNFLHRMLETTDWNSAIPGENDIDNKIMNIGCGLQYARDWFGSRPAGKSVSFLHEYLLNKINPETGLWGRYRLEDPNQLSRMVQFGYHLISLFLYDRKPIPHPEKVLDCALRTQNAVGGFGVPLNSSACEDIDSVDLLIKLSRFTRHREAEIQTALKRVLRWILTNAAVDGGFYFRKNEAFSYGHAQMSSTAHEGNMFATWFRTLCLAYLINALSGKRLYRINHSPGLEFQVNG
jgi:hypothetical protein